MNKKPILTLLMTALVTAGCASVSTPPPSLVEARNTVNSAASNPNVLSNAPQELRKPMNRWRVPIRRWPRAKKST